MYECSPLQFVEAAGLVQEDEPCPGQAAAALASLVSDGVVGVALKTELTLLIQQGRFLP